VEGSNGEAPGIGRTLIDRAVSLKADKDALYEKIAANRRSLRDLATQGVLSDAEVTWVGEFYPVKQRSAA
jgi:hypothetical protein